MPFKDPEVQKRYNKAKYARDREKILAARREWYQSLSQEQRQAMVRREYELKKLRDPEKVREQARRGCARYRERHPDRHYMGERNARYKRQFGITIAEYETMFMVQGGVCAICQKPEVRTHKGKRTRLAVDHNHETGKIRALLCVNCNKGIGHFQDDPHILLMAVGYLRKHDK